MRWLAILFLATPALAAPPPDADLASPVHQWFEHQHSVAGAWCCDVADGHLLGDDEWRMTLLGYEVRIDGKWLRVPDDALRDPVGGPNPTGHAIVWYTVNVTDGAVRLYCFAPGWEY